MMKILFKLATGTVALALTACVVVSPESSGRASSASSPSPQGNAVASLQYLVNGPRVGGEVDDELMRQGFVQTATDTAGDQVWGYYRKSSTGDCVIVHFDAQRVVRSVAKGLPACKP